MPYAYESTSACRQLPAKAEEQLKTSNCISTIKEPGGEQLFSLAQGRVPLHTQSLYPSFGPLHRDLQTAQSVAELLLRGGGERAAEEKTETLQ